MLEIWYHESSLLVIFLVVVMYAVILMAVVFLIATLRNTRRKLFSKNDLIAKQEATIESIQKVISQPVKREGVFFKFSVAKSVNSEPETIFICSDESQVNDILTHAADTLTHNRPAVAILFWQCLAGAIKNNKNANEARLMIKDNEITEGVYSNTIGKI